MKHFKGEIGIPKKARLLYCFFIGTEAAGSIGGSGVLNISGPPGRLSTTSQIQHASLHLDLYNISPFDNLIVKHLIRLLLVYVNK